MARIAVIGDEMTALGLKLVGVKNSYIATPANVSEIFKQAKAQADIIAITYTLYKSLKEKVIDKEKIVIQIPDSLGGGEDRIRKLVREVIGFEIRV